MLCYKFCPENIYYQIMVKNTQSAAKFAAQIMKLSFFANRFGLPKNRLCWCIIVSQNEEGSVSIDPAVLIKGENMFIDIKHDNLLPLMNVSGCKTVAYKAVCNRVRGGYKLRFGNEEVFISAESIRNIYRSKIFSTELAEDARRYH